MVGGCCVSALLIIFEMITGVTFELQHHISYVCYVSFSQLLLPSLAQDI